MSNFKPIGNAKVVVAITGQALPLGQGITANRVDIQALSGNSGGVVIGDNTIKTDLSNGGIVLSPGDIYNIELITDLTTIFVNGTAGDGITFIYWIGDRN